MLLPPCDPILPPLRPAPAPALPHPLRRRAITPSPLLPSVPRCSRLLVVLFYMELHIGFGIVAGGDFIDRFLLSSSIGTPANSDLVGRSLGYPGRQPSAEIEGASPASVLVSWWFATSQQLGGAGVLCSLVYLLATSPSPAHMQGWTYGSIGSLLKAT